MRTNKRLTHSLNLTPLPTTSQVIDLPHFASPDAMKLSMYTCATLEKSPNWAFWRQETKEEYKQDVVRGGRCRGPHHLAVVSPSLACLPTYLHAFPLKLELHYRRTY